MNIESRQAQGEWWSDSAFLLPLLLDTLPGLIDIRTVDGVIRVVNQGAAEMFRKTPQEMVGKLDSEIFPTEMLTFIQGTDQLVLRSGYPRNFEETFEIFERTVFFEIFKFPIRDSQDQITAILTVANDLTSHKKVEDDLGRVTGLLQTLTQLVPSGVFRTDLEGRYTFVNSQWQLLSGMTEKEALGIPWDRILHPEDHDPVIREWNRTVIQEMPFAMEYRLLCGNGDTVWVRAEARVLRNPEGAPEGYLSTLQDITPLRTTDKQSKSFAQLKIEA